MFKSYFGLVKFTIFRWLFNVNKLTVSPNKNLKSITDL